MKRLLSILAGLCLLCSSAFAQTYTLSKDDAPAENYGTYTVGVDLPAGDYMASIPDGLSDTAFCLLDKDFQQLDLVSLFSFLSDESSRKVTLADGQHIMILLDPVILTSLSADQSAAADASDPLLTTISGVDLRTAFKDAENKAEASGDYPMLYSVGYSFTESLNAINISVLLEDNATASDAETYGYSLMRLLNTYCYAQNMAIVPASKDYYGGIYDVVNCSISAYYFSQMLGTPDSVFSVIIPAGSQGYGTLDITD